MGKVRRSRSTDDPAHDRGQKETVTTLVVKPRRAEPSPAPELVSTGSVPGRGLDDAT
jgi:hypothetical protein